jgi:Phosphotransferase enzyme family
MDAADLRATPPSQPPPAKGVRLDWLAVPAHVRAAVEQELGSTVVTVLSQSTGFSPGVAARLRLADGQRVFVKAVAPTLNPDAPAFHRREARIVTALPALTAVPRLVWCYDEGEAGWVVLVFEEVEGRPPAQPWRPDEADPCPPSREPHRRSGWHHSRDRSDGGLFHPPGRSTPTTGPAYVTCISGRAGRGRARMGGPTGRLDLTATRYETETSPYRRNSDDGYQGIASRGLIYV